MRGIGRNLDHVGRVTLPVEMREQLGIGKGDMVVINLVDNKIVIEKYTEECYCCGKTDSLIEYKGLKICEKCLAEANKYISLINFKKGK